MYIQFKRARMLLLILAFLQITNAQWKQIGFKPMMQAIPSIDSTYSVVHSEIYPQGNEDKFMAKVAVDFYVEKALQNKDKPKVQTANIQQQNNQNPSLQKKTQQDLSKKPQIQVAALAENNKQKIKWAITPPNPLSTFVIDNGVQHSISQAVSLQPQTKSADMASQDIRTDHLTPIDPREAMAQGQIKSQNQQRSQKTTAAAADVRQQHKALPKTQPPSPIVKKQQKSSNIILIIFGAVFLLFIFVFVKSQRKKKVSSLSILHSRLESYKLQHDDEDLDSFSKSKTSLQQDEGSDDQNYGERAQIYRYNDSRL